MITLFRNCRNQLRDKCTLSKRKVRLIEHFKVSRGNMASARSASLSGAYNINRKLLLLLNFILVIPYVLHNNRSIHFIH